VNGQGITYSSTILPKGVSQRKTVSDVTTEQWLTVSKADSITCTASASYGTTLVADVGLLESKGLLPGDYVTLANYHGTAYASATDVKAVQKALDGSGDSIRIYGHANDGSGPLSIDSPIDSIAGLAASIRDLDAGSYAGTDSKVRQKMHIVGKFKSTAISSTGEEKTRSSDYGTEYDLDMKAIKGSAPTGVLGYYVKPGMAIQGAVVAAQSGDGINLSEGTYTENVVIDKSLLIDGVASEKVTIDGMQAGSVFTIGSGATVTIQGVTIKNGNSYYGGGIYNTGTLNLKGISITGNTANYGGGINNQGTVNMYTGSSITSNNGYIGGGIYNGGDWGAGTVNMYTGSSIGGTLPGEGNTVTYSGGGIYNWYGTVNMYEGSSITGNAAIGNGAGAGGILNSGGQTVNMYSGSSITGNTASELGGGIENSGIVNMYSGSSITSNTARFGGGICIDIGGGTVTFIDSATDEIIATWPEYDTEKDPLGFFTTHNTPNNIAKYTGTE
jgi:hypothetical protein